MLGMAFPIGIVASFIGVQGVVRDLPQPYYAPAFTAGQREVVFGPDPLAEVTMEVRNEKITPAQFTPNKILGDSDEIYSIGYVRWSVTDGTLFDKPCRILKMDGITRGENKTKFKSFQYASRNTTTYWITTEGKILRQSVYLANPWETQKAECVYWKDHIDVSVDDKKSRKTFSVYPSVDLSLVDLQFKPMFDGQKVLMHTKEYFVFDPFTQAFLKYRVGVGGNFHGTFLNMKFEGTRFDIEGPKATVKAYISKEGDLVKVDLTESTALVLNNIPRSRDPMVQASVAKGH